VEHGNESGTNHVRRHASPYKGVVPNHGGARDDAIQIQHLEVTLGSRGREQVPCAPRQLHITRIRRKHLVFMMTASPESNLTALCGIYETEGVRTAINKVTQKKHSGRERNSKVDV
jgi:hypothetical protein